MQIANAESLEILLAVVVAVDPESRQVDLGQRGDPGGLQVAKRDDGVRLIASGEFSRVSRWWLVGERKDAHAPRAER